MPWFKEGKPDEAARGAQTSGTAKERGHAYIVAFMAALLEPKAEFKVGFGVSTGTYNDGSVELMATVVASVMGQIFIFTPHEAEVMAESMEATINSNAEAIADFDGNDVMQDTVLALRQAASKANELTPEKIAQLAIENPLPGRH